VSNGNILRCKTFNNSVGISLYKSTNCTIKTTNSSFNSDYGLKLQFSDNNTITQNTFNNNTRGCYTEYSHNLTITKSQANFNTEKDPKPNMYINGSGFYLEFSDYSKISHNTFNYNGYLGLLVDYADFITIFNNTANFNHVGITIESSDYSQISNNTANFNSISGIHISLNNHSTFIYNNASYNGYYGISLSFSYYNNLSFNILIGNIYCIDFGPYSYGNILVGTFVKTALQGRLVFHILP